MAREQGGMHMTKMGNFQQWGWEYFAKQPSDARSSSGTIARTYVWVQLMDTYGRSAPDRPSAIRKIHSSGVTCDVPGSMATSKCLSGDFKPGNKTPQSLT